MTFLHTLLGGKEFAILCTPLLHGAGGPRYANRQKLPNDEGICIARSSLNQMLAEEVCQLNAPISEQKAQNAINSNTFCS